MNLAAIPDTLLESELFGHEKGAFTGAHARKPGKFELAHGGTLFLDEVGSLRIDLQAKLLRALQEREVERLGGVRTTPVDVRVIAATNIDLKQAVRARTFREDLFYRLNVVPLSVPPLRDRKEDIALLVDHFVKKYSREFKKDVRGVSQGALPALEAYDWPGNVRELENVIERSVALATRPVILLEDLPLDLAMHEPGQSRSVRRAVAAVAQGGARALRAGLCAARARARGLEPEPHGPGPRRPSQYPHRPARRLGHPSAEPGHRPAGDGGGAAAGRAAGGRRVRLRGTGSLGAGGMAPRPWAPFGLAVLSIAVVLLAGCASAPAVPPGVLDLSGVWEGTWNGGPIGRGRITLTLTQAGTKVTGSLKMSGATAISATDGPVEGVVTDTTFSFEQPGGFMQGDMAIVGEDMSGETTGRIKATLRLRRQPQS